MNTVSNLDDVFSTLSHRHRRYALYRLREEGSIELETLARELAARDVDLSPSEVPASDVQKLIVEFQHQHIGVLAETSYVEYDDWSGVLRYHQPSDPIPKLLEAVAAVENSRRG